MSLAVLMYAKEVISQNAARVHVYTFSEDRSVNAQQQNNQSQSCHTPSAVIMAGRQ